MDRSDEADDGDEQQEEADSDHASDDVDAGDDAEALPPHCYTNQEQPHQLTGQSEIRKLNYCTETLFTLVKGGKTNTKNECVITGKYSAQKTDRHKKRQTQRQRQTDAQRQTHTRARAASQGLQAGLMWCEECPVL